MRYSRSDQGSKKCNSLGNRFRHILWRETRHACHAIFRPHPHLDKSRCEANSGIWRL